MVDFSKFVKKEYEIIAAGTGEVYEIIKADWKHVQARVAELNAIGKDVYTEAQGSCRKIKLKGGESCETDTTE